MIQVDAVLLKAAQIIALLNLPWIVNPEFLEFQIQFSRCRSFTVTVERLCHDNLPKAASTVRFRAVKTDETRRGIKI